VRLRARSLAEVACCVLLPVDVYGRALVEGDIAISARQVGQLKLNRERVSGIVVSYGNAAGEVDRVVMAVRCPSLTVVAVGARGSLRYMEQSVPTGLYVGASAAGSGLSR